MTIRTIQKVVAYVVAAERLLVFTHPRVPEAGLQVPAGTIEPGETPEVAAMREVREETGLTDFGKPEHLGAALFDMSPLGRSEIHHRHFFRLTLNRQVPEHWQHVETSGGTAPPELFEFSWLPLNAVPELAAGQGAYLHALQQAA